MRKMRKSFRFWRVLFWFGMKASRITSTLSHATFLCKLRDKGFVNYKFCLHPVSKARYGFWTTIFLFRLQHELSKIHRKFGNQNFVSIFEKQGKLRKFCEKVNLLKFVGKKVNGFSDHSFVWRLAAYWVRKVLHVGKRWSTVRA